MLPEPKTVVILGVPFHDVTFEETLAHIDALVADRKPAFLATANLDFATQASHDVELLRILLDSRLVLCDGTPLVWLSRMLGAPLRQRVAGSDLYPRLLAHAAAKGYSVYFLGADEPTLAGASAAALRDNPSLRIAGTFAPPRKPLHEFDHDGIVEKIRAAKPDILLVGMGCPKQEKWIYMNHQRAGVPVSIGIGACFDFAAGNFSRAPVWMRTCGLEWLYRLLQEPRRLAHRYWADFRYLVSAYFRQRRALRAGATPATAKAAIEEAPVPQDHRLVVWSGRVDATAVAENSLPDAGPAGGRAHVILDCSAVSFMDSTGLGQLLRHSRECRDSGGGLALLRPADAVSNLLGATALDRIISSHPTITRARVALGLGFAPTTNPTPPAPEDCLINCTGDLTAARVAALQRDIEERWALKPRANRLVLNLERVGFMDSSGLGMLIRLRKTVLLRPGASIALRGANANIRNVIELARLQTALALAA